MDTDQTKYPSFYNDTDLNYVSKKLHNESPFCCRNSVLDFRKNETMSSGQTTFNRHKTPEMSTDNWESMEAKLSEVGKMTYPKKFRQKAFLILRRSEREFRRF